MQYSRSLNPTSVVLNLTAVSSKLLPVRVGRLEIGRTGGVSRFVKFTSIDRVDVRYFGKRILIELLPESRFTVYDVDRYDLTFGIVFASNDLRSSNSSYRVTMKFNELEVDSYSIGKK